MKASRLSRDLKRDQKQSKTILSLSMNETALSKEF